MSPPKRSAKGVRRVGKGKHQVTEPVSMVEVSFPNDCKPLAEWVPHFYGQQREFTRSFAENWETVFVAGNGTGKTLILYWNLVASMLGMHPYNKVGGLECVRTIPDAPLRVKVLVNDFEHGLDKVAHETLNFGTDLPGGGHIGAILPKSMVVSVPSKEDKSYRLANGSTMFFMTSEQKRKLHSGSNFDVLACDEEPKEGSYDESVRGLRRAKGGGRILHSFTPPLPDDPGAGPSWTKFKLWDAWVDGKRRRPDLHVIQACMMDNPAITKEFIQRFSHGKTEQQIQVQVYGKWPSWGRLVHPLFEDRLWDAKKLEGHLLPWDWEVPWHDEEGRFEFSIDWHASKPAAALWCYENRNGDVVVYDEVSPQVASEKTISQLSEAIREIEGWPHRKTKFSRFGDPKMKDKSNAMIRGFNAWDEFRHNGIYLSEGYNKQPEVGISIVNDFLQGDGKSHPRLFVRENCENLRRAMKNHYWVQAKDGTAVPDPKWGDYPICLRYILQRKSRKQKAGMFRGDRKDKKWGLTSYEGLPGYGPYGGTYVRDSNRGERIWH